MRRRRQDRPEERATAGASPSSTAPDVEQIQRLQQSAGNAAVSAMIARQDFQLQTPGIGGAGGYRPNISLGVGQLHLDPEIQAQAQAYVREQLTTTNVLDAIRQIPPSVVASPPANPLAQPAQPAQQPQQRPPDPAPPPGQEKAPEPGSAGTLLAAITEVPEVQQAINNLQQQTWGRLSGGQQTAVITSSVVLGAGALTGMLATERGRTLLSGLSGTPIPVPKVPGLAIEFTAQGGNNGFGLHLDVGRFLPPSLGFGPAGAGDARQPLFGGDR